MPVGLYVHVPFCARKCHYCNFVIALSGNARVRADYFTALEAEVAAARSKYGAVIFDTVYLGGGTPSELTAGETARLFEILRKNFSWKSDAEITVEANPGELDSDKLAQFRRHGVNRLSLGVQSANDDLLEAMNRNHTAADSERAARLAREAGFDNISMDLIIRLPGQTLDDVRRAVDAVVAWGARQVVVYDLAVHEETVYGLRRRQGELRLPDEAAHEQMFAAAEERFAAAGLEHYEVATFAQPGFESRHNLIYWNNQPYLGLGPGAFSYMDGVRFVYAKTVGSYLDKALRADWSNDEEDRLTPEEKETETLLTGLRLRPGVDLTRLPLIRNAAETQIPALAAQDLVTYDGRTLRLTRRGRYLAETVFVRLAG